MIYPAPSNRISVADCIDTCLHCHSVCVEAAIYAMNHDELGIPNEQIKLMLDCAETSQACANFLMRDSHFVQPLLELTREIAKRCSKLQEIILDENLTELFEVTTKCAGQCQILASMKSSGIPYIYHT